MCGIVGFLDKKNLLADTQKKELLEKMVLAIDHRGRDDRGVYVDGQVALGHTRLSILDLSKNGAQPFFNDEVDAVLSYNGEIYNYLEINQVLKKKYKLRSNCDTETLFYAYLEEESICLDKFKGMFAFSLYNKQKYKITLVVDRFSIKPLYFVNTPDWLAWSSEIKALLLLPGFKAELAEENLLEYFLFKQVSGKNTLFKNIERVLPAQVVDFDLNTHEVKKSFYWQLKEKNFSRVDYKKVLKEKLETSVKEHLLSDVPVGVQLSGGVDSSLVTALACKYKKNINTFSIGLANEQWNEFKYSRLVAEKYQTNHHEIIFTEKDFANYLPKLTYFYDEPISHSHSVPMYILAEKARKSVKVLLSGEGADEVFFGYKRYLEFFNNQEKKQDILFSNAYGNQATIAKILLVKNNQPFTYREELLKINDSWDWTKQVSYYDLKTYLPPLLLRQDKMGMAANLENRVPFLDHQLVEFGFSLPEALKINYLDNKLLLKEVTSEFLPADLIYRRKCGFAQPVSEWLKNKKGLGRYLEMFKERNFQRQFLNYEAIDKIIEEHLSGRNNHTEILWTLINLELWLRIFIDGLKPENVLSNHYESL
jgi:asparagine synthase (glutamine-hydrolysing)